MAQSVSSIGFLDSYWRCTYDLMAPMNAVMAERAVMAGKTRRYRRIGLLFWISLRGFSRLWSGIGRLRGYTEWRGYDCGSIPHPGKPAGM